MFLITGIFTSNTNLSLCLEMHLQHLSGDLTCCEEHHTGISHASLTVWPWRGKREVEDLGSVFFLGDFE